MCRTLFCVSFAVCVGYYLCVIYPQATYISRLHMPHFTLNDQAMFGLIGKAMRSKTNYTRLLVLLRAAESSGENFEIIHSFIPSSIHSFLILI